MITDVPRRAAPMRWARVAIPAAACGAVSVALPWFHPVLRGSTGPDDLGAQYAGIHPGLWIVGFGFLAALAGQMLAVGMRDGFLGRYTAAYGGAVCMLSGLVSAFFAYGSWHAHFDHLNDAGPELHRGVQAGFYLVVASGFVEIAVGLAVIVMGFAMAVRQGKSGSS